MPQIVGDYELIRAIGEGGYGKIFLARLLSDPAGDASSYLVVKQVKLPTNKEEREMCLR